MNILNLLLPFFAALGAGFVNAIAGGGTLISFPVLVALGIPPVVANVTNTIALCPGYFGGAYAQRKDFKAQKKRLWLIIPISVVGGIGGGLLLLNTPENSFRILIPYLILLATGLFAIQARLSKWMNVRTEKQASGTSHNYLIFLLILLAAVYGGYFGAGLSVILIAVLGLLFHDTLIRLNALKQATSLCINLTAAVFFSFSDKVKWPVVLIMAFGSISGGMLGGKLAGRLNPEVLRWIIVGIGLVVGMVYLF